MLEDAVAVVLVAVLDHDASSNDVDIDFMSREQRKAGNSVLFEECSVMRTKLRPL